MFHSPHALIYHLCAAPGGQLLHTLQRVDACMCVERSLQRTLRQQLLLVLRESCCTICSMKQLRAPGKWDWCCVSRHVDCIVVGRPMVQTHTYSSHCYAKQLGRSKSAALPGFHAFTGSDIVFCSVSMAGVSGLPGILGLHILKPHGPLQTFTARSCHS